MILEKQKQANVLQSGQLNESIGMSLDLDSAQVLMQMLSKNLYSDAIGSTIRECASNALDSHRRAKTDKPIVVKFGTNDQNNYEFSVEDFGIGLDADDVKNIISKYGKSTKRDSNDELGMMGLGFKAPLAYASSFYFTCRKDGIERKYMMYEGEDENTIDLLYTSPTTESNGVKIIIPVNWGDRWDFITKIKQQLAYFQNVYFDVNGIENDFLIYRGDSFQFSELVTDNKLHVCLDDVYYPLDFQKLGIKEICLSIGLTFTLSDGLFPTPNRESLRYTKEAKEAILSKIKEVANSMVDRYNKSIDVNNLNIVDAISHYKSQSRFINLAKSNLDITELITHATTHIVKPVIPEIPNLDLHEFIKSGKERYLLNEYNVRYRLDSKGRMTEVKKNHWGKEIKWDSSFKNTLLYIEPIRGNKKSYIKYLREDADKTTFIQKTKSFKLGDSNSTGYENYFQILDLKNKPKHLWRDLIKEFQWMVSQFIDNLPVVDDITIDQQWLDDKKALTKLKTKSTLQAKGPKVQGDVSCKIADELLRWVDGQNCKFVPSKLNVDNLNVNYLYIFESHDNSHKLDELYNLSNCNNIVLLTVSNRELEGMKNLELENVMHHDEFMKGDNLKFKQIVTANKIKSVKINYSSSFSEYEVLREIHPQLHDDIHSSKLYQRSHLPNNFGNSEIRVLKAMTEIADANNLYDSTIFGKCLFVEATLNNNFYIDEILSRIFWKNQENFKKMIYQLMDYHKLSGRVESYE